MSNPVVQALRFLLVTMAALLTLGGASAHAEEPSTAVDEASSRVRQAADAPADADDDEARGETSDGDSFRRYVERQASLEVQVGLRLYAEYDDYRAITALKRYRILDGSPHANFLASLMIGQIYHRNEKPTLAVLAFEESVKHAEDPVNAAYAYLMALQEMCLQLSYYVECRQRLAELAQTEIPDQLRQLVDYQVLYTDVVLRSPYVSAKRAELFREPLLRSRAKGLVEADEAFEELALKKPWLAGVLSGIVPGAGQVYNGRWGDGIIAFAMTGAFGAATYYSIAEMQSIPLSIVSGLFAVGFYAGNIANAVTDAQRINAERYREFFEDLKVSHWPRVQFRIEQNLVNFSYAFDWPGPTLQSKANAFEAERKEATEPAPVSGEEK